MRYDNDLGFYIDLTDSEEFINNSLGKKMARLRRKQGKSQEELGEKLNLSKASISRYENGIYEIPASLIIKLAKMYDKKVDWFFDQLYEDHILYVKDLELMFQAVEQNDADNYRVIRNRISLAQKLN